MSLTVVLRSCVNLRGKCDRLARITFRGVTYQSSIYENCSEAEWDEEYEWPLASPLDPSEFIEVEVFNFNKIFNNRLVGVFRMVLQKLIQDGTLEIQESLVDSNNTVLKAQVILDLQYNPPEGNVDTGWDSGIPPAPIPISGEPIEQPYQPLIIDRDHADGTMSERSFSTTRGASMTDAERRQSHMYMEMSNRPAGRPPSMPNIPMHFKNGGITQDTEMSNLGSRKESLRSINNQSAGATEISVVGPFDKMWKQEASSRRESFNVSELKGHSHPRVRERKKESVKEQDYQVQVRVLECRQLAGTQLDPVCTVTVGNQKKHTAVKEQTNCPYWDEFFVFDFKMPSSVLFDKIINLQVFTGRNLVSQGSLIGSFKLDVGTVYAQVDHRFCRRWAVLTDPEETLGASGAGVKGYLKVDITVLGKGDPIKEAPAIKDNDEDIEGNLLLPEGVPAERPKAQIVVKIYRAEGLPKMNSGLMANVKKAFTGEVRDLADPYVEVSFAGHKQRTSVKKHTYEPAWNEQVVFAELFPPLCRRIRVQLKDSDSVSDEVIGSHFIDLSAISNDGANGWNGDLYRPVSTVKSHKKRKADRLSSSADVGFMPTFGPCWVNLYGSTRDYSLFDEHNDLNNGLGEGVSYRGRLLMAVQAETGESASDSGIKQVEVEAAAPISETAAGKEEQFQLFACLYEASMIDRKVGDKNIQFEMTVGNYGNQLDRTEEKAAKEVEENPFVNSISSPARPVTNNRQYYHIPWDDAKPCLHVKFPWQDHRRRLYNANIIYKICERFEDGLVDILERVKMDLPDTYKWLSRVLGELVNGCTNYLNLMKSVPAAAHIGRTKLDQERLKLCNYEIEAVMQAASDLKVICKDDMHTKENMKTANGLLQRLLNIASEPQDSLPDIFIWMLCGNKRVAYTRVPAQHVLYSLVEEERGKDSGRMQTLFLRLPGKRGEGPKGWAIQSKLNIMIWLGLHKHKKDYLKDAPKGYDMPRNAHKLMAPPPNDLVYKVKQKFVLRSHLYQARSLIGSDASGLSDAFAKVIFTHFIAETRVIWETRSPTWDQTIIFEDIYLWGDVNEIAVNPPTIVVEIFDKDIGGDSEFIGRALARPIVKMACEPYEKPFFPPALEWFQIFRGEEKAGELLAAFELLQVIDGTTHMPPEVEPVNTSDGPICPVPEGIRPVMKKHRIEVLFWGVREMKRLNLQTVDRPQVDIECAGRVIQSTVIANARRNPNFQNPVDFFDVELPENERYCPPLTVRVRDCRTFGRFSLVGTHVLNSLHRYRHPKEGEPIERASIKDATEEPQADPNTPAQTQDVTVNIDDPAIGEDAPEKPDAQDPGGKKKKEEKEEEEDDSEDTLDWWSRYYETMKFIDAEAEDKKKEEKRKKEKKEQEKEGKDEKKDKKDKKKEKSIQPEVSKRPERKKNIPLIQIYRTELENVPEFNNFNDWLHSFSLYRGKKTSEEDDDEHRVVGKFKGSLKVWQYPLPENVETDPVIGTFRKLPSNEPVNVLVRVYVVKAYNLHPGDPLGKADPYPVVTLGKQKVKDRDNYISKQLNPIFGRTFEFEALIPMDSILTVGIYDWDLVGSDDLIGETKIDLENRFYSKHRATCGLQEQFTTFGFNKWRDPQRPTHILAKFCKDEGLDGPHYNNGKVQVDGITFRAPGQIQDESGNWKQSDEPSALTVLRNMDKVIKGHHLVPEHVETRSLYCPDKPGVEQGQIEMWVDMFPRDMQSPGAPVDITPRKPTSYELRIIVWNTDEVVMDDTNVITGEKCSDIFVKGWIEGMKDEKQETDVHYKSMTGEGNFNWRLIFPFNYQRAEERIIIMRKASFFSWDESEEKVPPRVVLQVWDADAFSADDFIGDLALDLNRMPRGAKSVKTCNLDMAKKDGTIPHVSLFKLKHMRGWWPFTVNTDLEEIELAGKLEAEFELLTEEEAEKKPAGKGREEPEPLPKPNRPDTSFVWFMNPLKSLRYMLWNNYKMCIVKFLVIFLLLALMGLFFYSMPGYTVKKIFNA